MSRRDIRCQIRWFIYCAKRLLLWNGTYRPKRMYRNGRGVDANFLQPEQLYFRIVRNSLDSEGKVTASGVRSPDQSVNRGKYSQPSDVLLPNSDGGTRTWLYNGVAAIQVSEVPKGGKSGGGVMFTFTVEHDPEEDNYSHTELRAYKDGRRESSSSKIASLVRKEYRTNFALRSRVVIPPLV